MSLPSGVPDLERIEVLRNSAPLFVNLLDDDDGIGVVRFDTDAIEAEPVQIAGSLIGGTGRADAITAIANHTTNINGMTAIGDGVVAAETQLDLVAASYDERATVVFTDGHETDLNTSATSRARLPTKSSPWAWAQPINSIRARSWISRMERAGSSF